MNARALSSRENRDRDMCTKYVRFLLLRGILLVEIPNPNLVPRLFYAK